MKDEYKTQKPLINELMDLRKRIAELGKSEAERKRVEEELRAASDNMVLRANNLPGGNHEKKEQECQDG
jgi:hypothetical protein